MEGIVYAAKISEKVAVQIDTFEKVDNYVPGEDFLWVHMNVENDDAHSWLMEKSGIDPLHVAALLSEDSRPRALFTKEGVLICMRAINFNKGEDPEDMVFLHLWMEKNRIITVRQKRVRAVEDIIERVKNGTGPKNSKEFLIMLAERITQRMASIIGEIDESVDLAEEKVLTAEKRELRVDLLDIRRKTVPLRRYIVPQRDMLTFLYLDKNEWFDDFEKLRIHELAEMATRYIEDLESIRDRASLVQEELTNILADNMNRTVYLLTIIATIFLPLGLLTGLLGINVGGIPGAENKLAFWIVCAILLSIAIGEYLLFKRSRKI